MTLTPLIRKVTLTDMVAYAGATWDWHRLHYDPEFLSSKGLERPVVDGQMLGALMVEQILDEFGPTAYIVRFSIKYKAMMFAGDTVRVLGERLADESDLAVISQKAIVGETVSAEGRAMVRLGI